MILSGLGFAELLGSVDLCLLLHLAVFSHIPLSMFASPPSFSSSPGTPVTWVLDLLYKPTFGSFHTLLICWVFLFLCRGLQLVYGMFNCLLKGFLSRLLWNLCHIILVSLSSQWWDLLIAFFHSFGIFLVLGMRSAFLLKTGQFWYYVLRLCLLFKPLIPLQRGTGGHCKVEVDVQVPHLAANATWEGLLFAAGQGGSSDSNMVSTALGYLVSVVERSMVSLIGDVESPNFPQGLFWHHPSAWREGIQERGAPHYFWGAGDMKIPAPGLAFSNTIPARSLGHRVVASLEW